jgi:hypothetical protein
MDVDIDDFDDSFDVDDDFLRDLDNAEQSLIAASQAPRPAAAPPAKPAVTEPVQSSSRTGAPGARQGGGTAFTFGAAARPPARLPPGHALRQQQHLLRQRDAPVRPSQLPSSSLFGQQQRAAAVPAAPIEVTSRNETDEAREAAELKDQLAKVNNCQVSAATLSVFQLIYM